MGSTAVQDVLFLFCSYLTFLALWRFLYEVETKKCIRFIFVAERAKKRSEKMA